MTEILAMMDTCKFIERYSVYNWVEEKRSLFWQNLNLTPAGKVYANFNAEMAFDRSTEVIPTWTVREAPVLSYQYDKEQNGIMLRWEDVNNELVDVCAVASPDADGSRRMQGFGDFRGDICRDTFQCDGEGAGFFQLQGVGNQLLSRFAVLALDAEAAELMDGLRRQSDVADDGDTGRRHGFDGFADTGATFELDGIAARFFHEPAGIVQGLLGAFLIAHEGHVADDQSPFDAADDSRRMVDHIFHGHRQCRRMTHDDIAQGIADKNHVDTGFIDVLGHDVVIGRNHGNRRAFLFHFLNGQIGYFLVHGELLPPSQGFLSACFG